MQPRVLGLALLILLGLATQADAKGIVLIVTGDDVHHIADIPDAGAEGPAAVGYHYSRFGLFWVDFWRYDGEFIVYRDSQYAVISEEEANKLGASGVPWIYHFPPGLVLLGGVLELFLFASLPQRRPLSIGLGVGLLGFGGLLFAKGVTFAFAVPVALGVYHIAAAFKRHEPAPPAPAGEP
jgi:hypothetical protein